MKYFVSVITCITTFTLFTGCGNSAITFQSVYDDKVVIDGQVNDWENSSKYIEKSNMSVGAKLDKNNLYLLFTSSDRNTIMKTIMNGSTVWIEPKLLGKKLGVKFPNKSIRNSPGARNTEPNTDNLEARINENIQNCTDIDILDEDKQVLATFSLNDPIGIRACMKYSNGVLTYELKLPLTKEFLNSRKYNFSEEKEILVKFETNTFERSNYQHESKQGDNTDSEQRPHYNGGMGGRNHGNRGGDGFRRNISTNPIEIEFNILTK